MKALFITILIFASAFAAFDYFLQPPGQKIIFKSMNNEGAVVATPSEIPATTPDTAAPPTTASGTVKDTPPAPTGQPTTGTTPAATADAPPPVPNASGFAVPKFEPLETLSKGWTMIPKTAFPRQVHINKVVPFKMSIGSSNMNAGTIVTALGFENGQLTLAPTATSAARATVGIDDTDLKAVLNDNYEKWKVLRVEWLKKAYEQRIAHKASAPPEPVASGDNSQAPTRGGDGSYPLLVAHINSGEVNEIKVKNIHEWADPVSIQYEGKPAWGVKIRFDAETVFGLQPVEAQAIVSGGRVKGWFYIGSGEPVP